MITSAQQIKSELRGNVLVVLLTVLLLITLCAAGYFYLQTQKFQSRVNNQIPPTIPPTLTPTDETANWKVYSDSELGLTFKYPQDWYAARLPDSKSVVVQNSPIDTRLRTHGYFGALNIIAGDDYRVPTEWLKNLNSTLGGLPAHKETNLNAPSEGGLYFTETVLNYRLTTMRVFFPNSDKNGGHDKTFDQILSTFKFLN